MPPQGQFQPFGTTAHPPHNPTSKRSRGLLIGGIVAIAVLAVIAAGIAAAIVTGQRDSSSEAANSGDQVLGRCMEENIVRADNAPLFVDCTDPAAFYSVFANAPGNDFANCLDVEGSDGAYIDIGSSQEYCLQPLNADPGSLMAGLAVGQCVDVEAKPRPVRVSCGGANAMEVVAIIELDKYVEASMDNFEICDSNGAPDADGLAIYGLQSRTNAVGRNPARAACTVWAY